MIAAVPMQFEVVAFSQTTTEFFANTGSATGTFQNKRAVIDVGCAGRFTVQSIDNTLRGLMKSGEMALLYDKWFMRPIPPANTAVNLPASEETKAAWANPTDKPAEEYARR
jgi:hypothetical protein